MEIIKGIREACQAMEILMENPLIKLFSIAGTALAGLAIIKRIIKR